MNNKDTEEEVNEFKKLDIIIINWNSGSQLRECLSTVNINDINGFELSKVIVVDNASADDSLEGIEQLNLPVKIIRNSKNLGFGAACNQGALCSNADYLLFLNPDTRLNKESLVKPLLYMEAEDNRGVGVCSIKLVDDSGRPGRTCTRLPKPRHFFVKIMGLDHIFPKIFKSHFMTEWDHNDTRQVEHVIGAFYFVRRKVFIDAGMFDERFFVYLEDLDLSLRIKKLGYSIQYLADVEAYHKGGGTSEQVKATRLFYSIRSRIIYGFKHFSFISAFLLLLATYSIEPIARFALALLRRSSKEMMETAQGYKMLIKNLPKILKGINE
ncbi:MAG: glycosyltransferase family 2 protein [Bacillota bacterium]|nr:glycosyltransferase family 2 protein [Bacillota bacterium]